MVKISVIVPCYNVEKYLSECLESIVNQTLKDIEIICIDDGSTDKTSQILKSYLQKDSRIKLITQKNKGLSASRNIGIEKSKGDYISFIDADDYMELTSLEKSYYISKKYDLDMLIFKLINFDENYVKSEDEYFNMKFLKDNFGDNVFNFKDVGSDMYTISVTAPGKLFKADLIKDISFPEGVIFEDNPFFIMVMFKAERVLFYDEFLYNRRIRFDSITQSANDRFHECIDIFNMVIDITKEFGYYEDHIITIFQKKMYNIYRFFKLTNIEDKNVFFNKIRKDFISLQKEYEYLGILDDVETKARLIFDSAIESESPCEFELTVRNYELKNQIKSLKKFNDLILYSKSWKVTKPLRIFTKFIRTSGIYFKFSKSDLNNNVETESYLNESHQLFFDSDINGLYQKNIKVKLLMEEYESLSFEKERLLHKKEKLLASGSWKITKFLRKLLHSLND